MSVRNSKAILGLMLLIGWLVPTLASAANATNVFIWNKDKEQITADVRDWELLGLLEAVAGQTGWHVFVEPDDDFRASVKFKDLPVTQGLRRLLGELNFTIMPSTNGPQRLFVFRTAIGAATKQVRSGGLRYAPKPKRIPNELIIRVKPGTDIEALAKALGAKIVGRLPEMNAYRLEFESEAAAEAARQKLLANPDVLGVEYNYYLDQPLAPRNMGGGTAPQTKIKLSPVARESNGKMVIGLVDTALQKQSAELEQLIKDRISLAGEYSGSSTSPTHADAMFNAAVQAYLQAYGDAETSISFVHADVFGSSSTADMFTAAVGMYNLYQLGATAINGSFGGYGESPFMSDVVKFLTEQGVPVFAAVGNDASSVPFTPASIPEVIAVTATQQGKLAPYVNVGTIPDMAAPGVVFFSFNGLVFASQGTSVSSAAAAGVAAGVADRTGLPWSQVIPRVRQVLIVPGQK